MPKSLPNRPESERFYPVSHTAQDTKQLLADPAVGAAYAALEDEYTALRALLAARTSRGRQAGNQKNPSASA